MARTQQDGSLHPCPAKTEKIPKKHQYRRQGEDAVRTTREIPQHRYKVSGEGQPCERVLEPYIPVRGTRTRCHKKFDHSSKRKFCPLLVPPSGNGRGAMNFQPGLYLQGAYGSPVGVTCSHDDLIMREGFAPTDFDLLFFGPLVVKGQPPMIACTLVSHYGLNTSLTFTFDVNHKLYNFVVSEEAARACLDRLNNTPQPPDQASIVNINHLKRALQTHINRVAPMLGVVETMKGMANADPNFKTQLRAYLRNRWYQAMYHRRWRGPGTPYPIKESGLNHRMIEPGNVSNKLRGKTTRNGMAMNMLEPVEKRLIVMESLHAAKAEEAKAKMTYAQRDLLAGIKVTERGQDEKGRIGYDGSYFPAFDSTNNRCLIAQIRNGHECVRMGSLHMLYTISKLIPAVYKNRPGWADDLSMYDRIA